MHQSHRADLSLCAPQSLPMHQQESCLKDGAVVKLMRVKALGVSKGHFEQHGNSADKQELVSVP